MRLAGFFSCLLDLPYSRSFFTAFSSKSEQLFDGISGYFYKLFREQKWKTFLFLSKKEMKYLFDFKGRKMQRPTKWTNRKYPTEWNGRKNYKRAFSFKHAFCGSCVELKNGFDSERCYKKLENFINCIRLSWRKEGKVTQSRNNAKSKSFFLSQKLKVFPVAS